MEAKVVMGDQSSWRDLKDADHLFPNLHKFTRNSVYTYLISEFLHIEYMKLYPLRNADQIPKLCGLLGLAEGKGSFYKCYKFFRETTRILKFLASFRRKRLTKRWLETLLS